jgi:hypothetical protein
MEIDLGASILVQGAIEVAEKHLVELGTRHGSSLLSLGGCKATFCDNGVNEPSLTKLHEVCPQNSQTHEVSRFEGKGHLLLE